MGKVFGGTIPAQIWKGFMTQALANVPATDFSQPAPLSTLTDALAARQRGGINPGTQQAPADTPLGGPYIVNPPSQTLPPVTTTLAPPQSTTSSSVFGGTTSTTHR